MRRLLVPALAAVLLLTGCTEQPPTVSDGQGDGLVQQWSRPKTAPVDFSGKTVEGGTFDSAKYRGKVLVVNFWWAGCGPCRSEAPTLKSLASEFRSDGVQFVGVNTLDDKGTAESFERDFTPGYPSILDAANGAAVQLAFAGSRGPKVTPTTLVLDREGRVTARIASAANASILKTLIQDAVDGNAA